MDAIITKLKSQREQLLDEVRRIDAALAALTEGTTPAVSSTSKTKRRQRRKMTAAERRAVSERMKKSWAERKRKARR